MQGRAVFAALEKMVPTPVNVAMLGMEKAVRGAFEAIAEITPFYVRKSEAEVKWAEKV